MNTKNATLRQYFTLHSLVCKDSEDSPSSPKSLISFKISHKKNFAESELSLSKSERSLSGVQGQSEQSEHLQAAVKHDF